MADEFDEFLARHLKKYLSKDEKYYAPLEQNTTVYDSTQPYTYNSGTPAKRTTRCSRTRPRGPTSRPSRPSCGKTTCWFVGRRERN